MLAEISDEIGATISIKVTSCDYTKNSIWGLIVKRYGFARAPALQQNAICPVQENVGAPIAVEVTYDRTIGVRRIV